MLLGSVSVFDAMTTSGDLMLLPKNAPRGAINEGELGLMFDITG